VSARGGSRVRSTMFKFDNLSRGKCQKSRQHLGSVFRIGNVRVRNIATDLKKGRGFVFWKNIQQKTNGESPLLPLIFSRERYIHEIAIHGKITYKRSFSQQSTLHGLVIINPVVSNN